MKELPRLLVLFAVMLVGPISGVLAEDSVEGVWQVSRIDRDSNAEPNINPQPGIVIFTEMHYSMVITPRGSGMQSYSKRWAPTDVEKLKRSSELMVNSGTYELDGSQLTAHPIAAKDPDLIGGVLVYKVNWSNGDLILTYMDEYSFDDVQFPAVETSGGKLHFTLTRISE
jgi:hypothetical protein